MISVTLSGQPCWLLPYQIGDNSPLKLSVSIPVNSERGLTGNSSRRPDALAPRYVFDYRAILLQKEFAQLRAASLAAQDEPILCPLWPHMWVPGVSSPTITSGLIVAFTADFATYAINPGSYAGYTYAAPLIYGRFRKPPRLASIADGFIAADLSIEEDAPVGYGFAPATGILPADTTYTNSAGYSAPVFPFVPDWSSAPTPALAITDVERHSNGPGRQKASTFYPQVPEQIQTADFAGIGSTEAAQIIAWWVRRCGEADAHWVATNQSLWHLAANAAIGATSITLTLDTPAPAVGANLALNGAVVEIVRVTGVAGAVLTLASPLVNAWSTDDARVMPAMLARHTDSALQIQYSPGGWIADYRLAWREVAGEYAVPSGETRGTTLGRLPAGAWFYRIELDYNGAIVPTYLTGWESGATGATVGGCTWIYNPCDFDKLIQSDDLADDSCTFTMRWFAGCPFENWLPGALSARGFLTIYRADVDSAGTFSNFLQIWRGEISTPTPDGPNLSVKVLGANALFSRRVPRQIMSLNCGTSLFKTRCGLLISNWIFSTTIAAVSGNLVTLGVITRDNGAGLPSGFGTQDWFALGYIQWTASGNPMREGILASTSIGGGSIILTLDRPCPLTAGASIKVIPGCDRIGTTCRNRFSNYGNFRGFEFMPAESPNFKIPQRSQTTGKK